MAVPKPSQLPPAPATDHWGLPPEGAPIEFDERRLQELLNEPGVVVRRRDPERARRFAPLATVGYISLEELRRLMGRDPEDGERGDDDRLLAGSRS